MQAVIYGIGKTIRRNFELYFTIATCDNSKRTFNPFFYLAFRWSSFLMSGLFKPFTTLSTTTNPGSLEKNWVSVLHPKVRTSKLGSNFLRLIPSVEIYASLLSL